MNHSFIYFAMPALFASTYGWIFVILAAIFEFISVIGLKQYSHLKTIKSALLYIDGFASSFAFLYQSFHYLQVSITYAVWIGIGTARAVLINMILFGESKSVGRILSSILIIIGVVGLKYVS